MATKYGRILIAMGLSITTTLASADWIIGSGDAQSLTSGASLSLGCGNLDIQGSLLLDNGHIGDVASVTIGAAGELDFQSGTITLGGNWSNSGTFIPGTGSVVFTDACSTGPSQFTGDTTFNNLTLSSSSGRTFVVPAGSHITVNGTLTLQGEPGLPIQLASSSAQTAYILLGPNAQVVRSNATVPANVQIGASVQAEPIPSLSEYGLILLSMLLAAMAVRQLAPSAFARPIARTKSHGVKHDKN